MGVPATSATDNHQPAASDVESRSGRSIGSVQCHLDELLNARIIISWYSKAPIISKVAPIRVVSLGVCEPLAKDTYVG